MDIYGPIHAVWYVHGGGWGRVPRLHEGRTVSASRFSAALLYHHVIGCSLFGNLLAIFVFCHGNTFVVHLPFVTRLKGHSLQSLEVDFRLAFILSFPFPLMDRNFSFQLQRSGPMSICFCFCAFFPPSPALPIFSSRHHVHPTGAVLVRNRGRVRTEVYVASGWSHQNILLNDPIPCGIEDPYVCGICMTLSGFY